MNSIQKLAESLGFVLDESVSVKIGTCATITLDHPTHSFGGDCRSITVSGHTSISVLWKEIKERLDEEAKFLTPCTDPNCEYHNAENI